jgi:hypothetical protein
MALQNVMENLPDLNCPPTKYATEAQSKRRNIDTV